MSNHEIGEGGIKVDLSPDAKVLKPQPEHKPHGPAPLPNDNYDKVKTLEDLALSHIRLEQFPVVHAWRKKLFSDEGRAEICDELPRLLTEYLRQPETVKQTAYLRRANALNHIFSRKQPLVQDSDLLPGQTTTSFVGPVVYADTIGYCIWPELQTVSNRAQNPFRISADVAERLNKEIFPYWLNRKPVQEVARYSDYDTDDYANENRDKVKGPEDSVDPPLKKRAGETPKCQELMERVAFYLSDKATCVSHTVPDFERVLKYGLNTLIQQMQQDLQNRSLSSDQSEFLQGVITVFQGAITYAMRLAEAAKSAGNQELARICQKVPAEPASTLHEAISSVWICYHLLLQENTNFGFSIGRLDQLLNPFYLSDWKKLTTAEAKSDYVQHAVELVCHFFLRCSDHVPLSTEGSETLFAGSGSNQALTVGGTHYRDGTLTDAVNDMTYIILKATEILGIRDPNVHARYHKDIHHRDNNGAPLAPGEIDPYLARICQVNMITKATPAIHGDAAVAHSMARYYAAHSGIDEQEALSDAYDYASIGCIEENSAGKHYGNTGSTLMVLPAVLELALFGGKHRSDGTDNNSPNLFYGKKNYTTPPLTQMKSMQEFVDAFEFQLDEMARHAVQCNNYIGRAWEKVRPSPFLSGLFSGPTNTPETDNASFRDVAAGGAKYNSAGVAIIGLADVIDSFCVIDELVFGGKIKASELIAGLKMNFGSTQSNQEQTGNALLRFVHRLRELIHGSGEQHANLSQQRLAQINEAIKLAPKYGAGVDQTPGGTYDNSLAVKYTHVLTKMLNRVFYKYRTHRGGRYLVGYWSMTNHAGFGMLTKATPNGRCNSRPFASGITPCPGVVKRNGDDVKILDHILSVAEVDADTVTNGYTYNLSLTARDANYFNEDTDLFANYMKAFFDNDGVLVQMCVSSIDELAAAHKAAIAASRSNASNETLAELDKYKDLMIRVAGYSAYFVTLSPQMREEIIARSNFALSTGQEQHTLAAI